MIRKTLLLGLAGLMAIGVFALGGESAQAGAGSATLIALDTDQTGNSATAVGTIEDCVEANAGDTVVMDLVVQGIPASNAMIAYQGELTLQNSVLNVTANDATSFMINAAAGSQPLNASDAVPGPGPDNLYYPAAADTGPFSAAESGSGVLARLDIQVNASAADGIYNVNLTAAGHVDTTNATWAPDAATGARIAVGALTCTSTFPQGDINCSNIVNSVDALGILRFGAGLSVNQTEPCDDVGTGTPKVGDVDCTGVTNSVDALKILRFGAGLSVSQTEPCPDIGT